MNWEFSFSKYGKRNLSTFFAKQMLFDYVEEELDDERMGAFEDYLSCHPEFKKKIENIEKGIYFCKKLQQIKLSNELQEEFRKKLEKKPLIKRTFFPYWKTKTLVTVVIVMLFIYRDKIENLWISQILNKSSTIVKVDRDKKFQVIPRYVNEEPISSFNIGLSKKVEEKETGKGAVYRVFMENKNIEETSDIIVNKIIDLGGRKAGEVKLGWKKKKGSYFYFILPEKNKKELMDFLKQFSVVRVEKQPHERIISYGNIRLILWVKENK